MTESGYLKFVCGKEPDSLLAESMRYHGLCSGVQSSGMNGYVNITIKRNILENGFLVCYNFSTVRTSGLEEFM